MNDETWTANTNTRCLIREAIHKEKCSFFEHCSNGGGGIEALMVKFGGEIGTLYQMLKNAFKKHPLQNRTNVQIKGGGQRPFEQCSKKLHFSLAMASLSPHTKERVKKMEI